MQFKILKRLSRYLIAFRNRISKGKPEFVFLNLISCSRAQFNLCGKFMHVSLTFVRFETMNRSNIRFDISLQNLKIAFRYIFSPQIERKRSEEYLVINLAVERKL